MAKEDKMQDKVVIASSGSTTKMRIQLFDPKTNLMISDRLVEMSTELLKGPTEISKGPFHIETTLFSQTNVDMLITYLKKVKGELPIEEKLEKKSKTNKKLDEMLSDKEPLLDLLKAAKAKCKTQEDLITYLREYQFRFVAGDVITDIATPEMIKLKSIHASEYQFMLRLVKEAKDPANDKYDFRLVFGIKIVGEKIQKVLVYWWGEFQEKIKLPWESAKNMNFKKVEKVYIFPEFMDYADRKKWRLENRKYMVASDNGTKATTFETSKFYNKWAPYIKIH